MSNHKAGKALSLRRGASAPLSIASRESLERVLFASERECARERPKHSLIPTCAPFLSSAMHPAHAYPPPSATVSPRPSTPPPLAAPQTRPSWPATAAAPRQTGATPAAWQNFSKVSAAAYQPRTSTIGRDFRDTIGRDFREFLPAYGAATPLARQGSSNEVKVPPSADRISSPSSQCGG